MKKTTDELLQELREMNQPDLTTSKTARIEKVLIIIRNMRRETLEPTYRFAYDYATICLESVIRELDE